MPLDPSWLSWSGLPVSNETRRALPFEKPKQASYLAPSLWRLLFVVTGLCTSYRWQESSTPDATREAALPERRYRRSASSIKNTTP